MDNGPKESQKDWRCGRNGAVSGASRRGKSDRRPRVAASWMISPGAPMSSCVGGCIAGHRAEFGQGEGDVGAAFTVAAAAARRTHARASRGRFRKQRWSAQKGRRCWRQPARFRRETPRMGCSLLRRILEYCNRTRSGPLAEPEILDPNPRFCTRVERAEGAIFVLRRHWTAAGREGAPPPSLRETRLRPPIASSSWREIGVGDASHTTYSQGLESAAGGREKTSYQRADATMAIVSDVRRGP